MLNKTMISLAAAAVFASATAAFAYEAPENRIGDRYPFLEQGYQAVAANRLGSRNLMVRQAVTFDQYSNEAPENRIGDRYPTLEPGYQSVSNKFVGKYLAMRQASKVSQSVSQYAYEAPENRIGDRYPLLEQVVLAQRGPSGRYTTAGRNPTTGNIR